MCTPTDAALDGATIDDPNAALTNSLRHLRHALRCATRAIPGLEGGQAGQRTATLAADICAAARECAGILDNIGGNDEPIIWCG
ncbi:MAG: hypothetical protein QOJ56_949 [Mycobacterium sp.]|jgi:hypothetical protein|nr:hypothetical protein [Mycobacterium sp.]MDT5352417.1 hypothetical protein [Mycobacterium sp.]